MKVNGVQDGGTGVRVKQADPLAAPGPSLVMRILRPELPQKWHRGRLKAWRARFCSIWWWESVLQAVFVLTAVVLLAVVVLNGHDGKLFRYFNLAAFYVHMNTCYN